MLLVQIKNCVEGEEIFFFLFSLGWDFLFIKKKNDFFFFFHFLKILFSHFFRIILTLSLKADNC